MQHACRDSHDDLLFSHIYLLQTTTDDSRVKDDYNIAVARQ